MVGVDPLSHGPLKRGVGGESRPECGSWAELMQQHTKYNTTRPRPDSEYAKPPRVTRFEKSREEVLYNPVLQTFTDRSREVTATKNERSRKVSQLNEARDRQIARESQFDILNMSDKRSGLAQADAAAAAAAATAARAKEPRTSAHAETPTFRHPLDSCYQYNIVSNLPLSQHHYTAPELRPNVDERADDPKPRLQTTTALPRDYDVLSNRYREGHDAKVTLEREINRRTAAKKYWETHDYDPFTCTYYNEDKEAAYHEIKEAAMEEQPMKQFYKLPPSTQRSEGFVYDITTHLVKNEELYAKKQAKAQQWLDSKRVNWEREAQVTAAGMARQDLEDQRAINRQSHKRYTEALAHGFSIIDHRDYTDPDTFIPPPRTVPHLTTWQKVQPPTHLPMAERAPSAPPTLPSPAAPPPAPAAPPPAAPAAAAPAAPPPEPAYMAAPPSAAPMMSSGPIRTGGFGAQPSMTQSFGDDTQQSLLQQPYD